jgi:hypothetical protein
VGVMLSVLTAGAAAARLVTTGAVQAVINPVAIR